MLMIGLGQSAWCPESHSYAFDFVRRPEMLPEREFSPTQVVDRWSVGNILHLCTLTFAGMPKDLPDD